VCTLSIVLTKHVNYRNQRCKLKHFLWIYFSVSKFGHFFSKPFFRIILDLLFFQYDAKSQILKTCW